MSNMQAARGLFITVEGGEGVGKSTNITCIRDFLQAHGVALIETREPGGTPLGEDIRGVLLRPRDAPVAPMAELLLLFAARAQHLRDVIIPALDAGCWVICDRFTDASYAYQSGGRGLDPGAVRTLEELVQGALRPDYTLLLDAPAAVGLERARGRGQLDRFEREELAFFERVRSTYLKLASESSGRYRVVDASQPLPEVQRQLRHICEELYACWAPRQRQQR